MSQSLEYSFSQSLKTPYPGDGRHIDMKLELSKLKFNRMKNCMLKECKKCYTCRAFSKPIVTCKLRKCVHFNAFLNRHEEFKKLFDDKSWMKDKEDK